MDKYYLYARVSSKEQEREGFSIPAQVKAIREYANKKGFYIAEEFIEAETAKNSGRTAFTQMISKLRKNEEIKGILCEKVDRLTRNFLDYVPLDKLVTKHNKELHLIKEGLVMTKDSRSGDKLNLT